MQFHFQVTYIKDTLSLIFDIIIPPAAAKVKRWAIVAKVWQNCKTFVNFQVQLLTWSARFEYNRTGAKLPSVFFDSEKIYYYIYKC